MPAIEQFLSGPSESRRILRKKSKRDGQGNDGRLREERRKSWVGDVLFVFFPSFAKRQQLTRILPVPFLPMSRYSSFLKSYQDTLRLHDSLAQNRLKFATRLTEMADELAALAKEMEKTRKTHKDTGLRYERLLQDADLAMEKVRIPTCSPREEDEEPYETRTEETTI